MSENLRTFGHREPGSDHSVFVNHKQVRRFMREHDLKPSSRRTPV